MTFLVLRFSPKIAEESKPYVHHMLVYQCATPPPPDWNEACHSAPPTVRICRGTNILAGWAIGGKVKIVISDYASVIMP